MKMSCMSVEALLGLTLGPVDAQAPATLPPAAGGMVVEFGPRLDALIMDALACLDRETLCEGERTA
jgi:hypothetical protein